MRLLGLNVKSPPEGRAESIFEYVVASGSDVLFLSELSTGSGSARLMALLAKAGYSVVWPKPTTQKYSAALAAKNLSIKAVQVGHDHSGRVAVAHAEMAGRILAFVSLYVPTLNPYDGGCLRVRQSFIEELSPLIARLAAKPDIVSIVAGDFNSILPTSAPPYSIFAEEGFPLDSLMVSSGFRAAHRHLTGADAFTWESRDGRKCLVDGLYLPRQHEHMVTQVRTDHVPRLRGMSDHAAVLAHLAV